MKRMLRRYGIVLSVISVGTLAGCSKTEGPAPGNAATEQREEIRVGTSVDPRTVAQSDTPAAAVGTFLQAVRAGNDQVAAAMLTSTARKKTAEMNMAIAPPGSDTAQFEVGEVSLINDNAAQVSSKWSDLDHNAQRQSDSIIWVVKHEPEGWRVSGVAAPLVLDFEKPEEMMRRQGLAKDEAPTKPESGQSQAQRAENLEKPVRR